MKPLIRSSRHGGTDLESLRSPRARGRSAIAAAVRMLAVARVYRRLMLLERRLDEPIVDLPLPVGLAVRQLDLEDLGAYCAFRPDQDPGVIRRRLAAGEWAFTAWESGRIVTAGWTSPRRAAIEYLGWEITLAPDEGYSYDLFTAPGFRGHGLAAAARIPALRHARDHGCRRLFSALLPENLPGWSTPAAIGFRAIGWIGYVGPRPLRYRFCRLDAPAGERRADPSVEHLSAATALLLLSG